MRQPTLLLFSLVIGATMLVFTAERLDELMGNERALARAQAPSILECLQSYTVRAKWHSTQTLKNVQLWWRSIHGEEPEPTVVITEDTIETVWVWKDRSGVQRFSRKPPPADFNAREILYPRDLPLPDEQADITSSAERDQHATQAPAAEFLEKPDQALPALLIDENCESRFEEGLRNFRDLQAHHSDPLLDRSSGQPVAR